jgi:hypothetical protein
MNEIQMLLYGHNITQACEARGGLPLNSLWFWGGGEAVNLARPFERLQSDSDLANAFAQVANIPHELILTEKSKIENSLYVWDGASAALRRGDFYAWRQSVLEFEHDYLSPLLRFLLDGKLDKITLDVLQEDNSKRFELTRVRFWQFWIRPKNLSRYSLV